MPFIAYFAQTFFLGKLKIFYYKNQLKKWLNDLQSEKRSVGFIPTMGALHQGHLDLVHASTESTDLTIASVFVNPKQFDKKVDLKKYPRTEEKDIELLKNAGCHAVYLPTPEDLYDKEYKNVELDIAHLADIYEGEKRVGHFEGVIQVLYQFFDAIQPSHVFFGQKDYQQCMVVKRLIEDYFPKVVLETVATHRDDHGLALSSRNARLSSEGIKKARKFNQGLKLAASDWHLGKEHALQNATHFLEEHGLEVEYIDFANALDLTPSHMWQESPQEIVVVSAVWLEGVRLIDNYLFQP